MTTLPQTINLHITHSDVFNSYGASRPYEDNYNCPLAHAFRRKTNIETFRVGGHYIRVMHPTKPDILYRISRNWGSSTHKELTNRLRKRRRAYTPVTLTLTL